MARDVSGHDGEVVSFDTYFGLELGWDFGFVQVSTDGASWTSLACDGTTSSHNPDARASIVANVPGFTGPTDVEGNTASTGTAGAPIHVTCPGLPAGTKYLGFRLMTDGAAQFDGWHVKNIQLDDADVGTPGSTAGWDNEVFFNPQDLAFGVAFVGINGSVDAYGDITSADSVTVVRPTLDAGWASTLTGDDLDQLAGFERVVAVVWGIPDDESSTVYGPYSLLVNGTERADGS
jgi:hypothetical protein